MAILTPAHYSVVLAGLALLIWVVMIAAMPMI
jgi:hypothetical protein